MLWRGLRTVAFCIVVVAACWVLDGWVDQWWSAVLAFVVTTFAVTVALGAFVRDGRPPVSQDPSAGPVVRIDVVGSRWIEVVKAVRGATGLGLVPVKTELDREPARFVVRSEEAAQWLCAELERCGAVAVVETPGGRAGFGV
ncbi:ribosomal protein L7/L12 [Nocardioides sp. LML1-1-1.1]|uniref:ribosomal protein L7/L12 n=1 Tax=Nocardioides sp. LML1-1-1.1 TaxID=3135248 RepID=UPI0034448F52